MRKTDKKRQQFYSYLPENRQINKYYIFYTKHLPLSFNAWLPDKGSSAQPVTVIPYQKFSLKYMRHHADLIFSCSFLFPRKNRIGSNRNQSGRIISLKKLAYFTCDNRQTQKNQHSQEHCHPKFRSIYSNKLVQHFRMLTIIRNKHSNIYLINKHLQNKYYYQEYFL